MNPKSKIPEPMKNPILLYLTTLVLTALCGGAAAGQAAAQSAPDMSKYILTPKPADTPRINGARVFGVRPGSEFLYTIAATGVRPMTFSAEGLPKGLKLDPETGRITGRVTAPGEYTVHLKAANAPGSRREVPPRTPSTLPLKAGFRFRQYSLRPAHREVVLRLPPVG